jgi:hypothetical protein
VEPNPLYTPKTAAAALAHCLNSDAAPTVRIEPGALYHLVMMIADQQGAIGSRDAVFDIK